MMKTPTTKNAVNLSSDLRVKMVELGLYKRDFPLRSYSSTNQEGNMSIAKVIEVLAEGDSF